MAVTEAHLACTREEQLRWLRDSWRTCSDLLASGVPVEALTVWSLFGAFDWDRLVTEEGTFYEPGAFDVSGPEPRATAVAEMMRDLASEGVHEVPAMTGPGWWDRPDRFHYPVVHVDEPAELPDREPPPPGRPQRRLLILGGDGPIGRVVANACERRGLAFTSTPDDAATPEHAPIDGIMEWLDPWAVVDGSGLRDADRAERTPRFVREAAGRAILWGRACERRGIPLAVLSTDEVFDGDASRPYREDDPIAPSTVLGRAWSDVERALEGSRHALIVRSGPLFGFDELDEGVDPLATILGAATAGRPVRVAADRVASPTYLPHLVDVVLDLLIDRATGIWHVANEAAVTPVDVATAALAALELETTAVRPVASGSSTGRGTGRRFTALTSGRGRLLPSLDESLTNFLTVWAARDRAQQAA
jgi:dTDP-4-dehydrorhamnose reductase